MRKQNSREVYLNECKGNPSYCSALLEYDWWKFEKDYPMDSPFLCSNNLKSI